jgi:outer membrane protein assembly factor BamB
MTDPKNLWNHFSATLLLTLLALGGTAPALADDWPQYRGPNRDDVSQEKGLANKWPEGGPKLLWTYRDAGVGYSGPAVVGSRYYTLGDRGEKEYLIALDIPAEAGEAKEAWAVELGEKFDFRGNNWSAGPSATPTVDGKLIYALSGNGDLACVQAADGKLVWKKSLPADLQAQVNPIGGGPKNLGWGFTWSPLVDGERLICTPGGPGGTVAALDKKTGETHLAEHRTHRSSRLHFRHGCRDQRRAAICGAHQPRVARRGGSRWQTALEI